MMKMIRLLTERGPVPWIELEMENSQILKLHEPIIIKDRDLTRCCVAVVRPFQSRA